MNTVDIITKKRDGVALDAEEILSITTDNAPVAALADALMRRVRAYRLPKQDNTTFLLYRYVPSKGKKQ